MGVAASKKWQAESDLRTLRDAHGIHSDKKRHRAAQAMARAEMGKLSKIAAAKRFGLGGVK